MSLQRRFLALSFAFTLTAPCLAQNGPPPLVRQAVDSVVQILNAPDEVGIESFITERLDPTFRASVPSDELRERIRGLRAAVRNASGDLAVERDESGLLLLFSGAARVGVRIDLDESSGLITVLEAAEAAPADPVAQEQQQAVELRLRAVEAVGRGGDGRRAFVEEHLSPAFVAATPPAELDAMLDAIQRGVAQAGMMTAESRGEEQVLGLRGGPMLDVILTLEDAPPYRIATLRLDTDPAPDEEVGERLAWDTLAEQLAGFEREGFAGTVLAIRNGETVLARAYGPGNSLDSVYDIGSFPIDFTRAAIYLLMQRGELTLDDPVSRFIEAMPADKAKLTIRHLLEGRSGLPNFFHLTGEDPDLTYIDRAEAERRMLAVELLFEPGTGSAHSHAAFVLLAAIVEHASGRTYEAFLQDELFVPLGMQRTGAYGDDLGLPAAAFAPGDDQQVSDPNIPPLWGTTSWLIKGSGGMVASVPDIQRWFDGLRQGRVLQGEAQAAYLQRSHAIGASDRGFLFVHAWNRDDTMIFLAANAGVRGTSADHLERRIIDLLDGQD
jgi:CubicO group peptidase (beta-lactamase class C family)